MCITETGDKDVFSSDSRRRRALLAATLVPLAASGCTSFSPDAGMGLTAAIAQVVLSKETIKIASDADEAYARRQVDRLLASPLTADAAVQTALYNNKSLQAAYYELGVSEADYVQATLPENPTISLARLAGSGVTEIEARILGGLLDLVTLPKRRRIAEVRFLQAQLRAAEETLETAAEARRAYYEAVAAHQTVHLLERARLSADAASAIARELGKTGGLSKIDQARQHVFYAEITAQLGRARQEEKATRERLVRSMGLWGNKLDFTVPSSLPGLPAPMRMEDVEREALQRRVDLQVARLELEALARSLNLEDMTRFVDVLEVAGVGMWETEEAEGETEETDLGGLEIEFVVPIFDLGRTKIRRAEQQYLQAVNRLAALAVNVRSQAREAYQRYRGAYELARHYRTEILPLRQTITEESLLLYNSMNADVLDVLADTRAQVESNITAIAAQRDFWLARTDLQVALTSDSPSGGTDAGASLAASETGGH